MDGVVGLSESTLDRARVSRDPRFDGKFFIAVKTTGIYCRPICPSPRCKKINVTYYATAAAAAAAGYRPCRRCRPEVAPGSPAWLGPSAVVRRALRLIQEGCLDTGSVEDLATRLGIGARHLDRLFVQHAGVSPVAVAQTRRLHFAKQLLDETDLRVIDIAMAAGFGSIRRFNDAFLRAFGRSPRELRRRPVLAGAKRSGSIELQLAYRPPYDWDHLVSFLGARAMAGVEHVDAHEYTRTLSVTDGYVIVNVRPQPTANALRLRVTGATPAALLELATVAKRVFDIAADPAPISDVLMTDPILRPLLAKRPGLRVPGEWSPFECAVRAVLSEGVSIETGSARVNRLVKIAGAPVSTGVKELTHVFPTSRAILECAAADDLPLPKSRIGTLRSLAEAVEEGRIDFSASSDEVVRALRAVPGVGDWAAQYVALRALGEPDAFPASGAVRSDIEARAQTWRPWRGYAVIALESL